jgi:acetyl-CoA acetyltransferase
MSASGPPVAVVGFAQSPLVRVSDTTTNGVELLIPLFRELLDQAGMTKQDVGFWCSGSSDYLAGRAFSFVTAVDAIGAFPPVNESHVEADAAWALYEAWLKIRTGEVETALIYGFGKSSAGQLRRVLALQTDPYTVAPLWPDSVSIAALQARLGLESGLWTERQMAEVALRCRADALHTPTAQLSGIEDVEKLLETPYLAEPLRRHDCAPITDGAAVVLLAAGDRARDVVDRPAWITGSPSSSAAIGALGGAEGIDVAELHAPFTHQELLLRRALGLADDVRINPSGGVLTGNPMFAAGLARIGAAALQIISGSAGRALAHATSGPALQQNLVCTMEAQ